jgi:ribonuclease Z
LTFRLKIIGSNSAAPAFNRNQTSQVLLVNNTHFMIDCGEGTQLRLNRSRIRINKIDHIFLSHLHGDHYFGLIGLISTMHLFGRTRPLYIYGPGPIKEIIEMQLKYSDTLLNFELIYYFTDQTDEEIIFENKDVVVRKFPLNHRIFCTGFIFREKPKKPKIRKDKIPKDFSLADITSLKKGKDIFDERGNLLYKNEDLTLPPKRSRSYAFCSDTKYDESILKYISDVDLLYHEATFANDMKERAENTFHSTAEQAASMAIKARAQKLLLGHYSVRYKELDVILEEARNVFKESYLSIEGSAIEIED